MNTAPTPSTDTPALLPPRRGRMVSGLAAVAMALTFAAGQALARDVVPAPEPSVIAVEMETDCLYWDLCVGKQRAKSISMLAERIAAGMDEPESYYVVELPQLGAEWISPGTGAMDGLSGEPINRRRLALYRSGYEGRVENALVDVVRQVQELRPGARLSVRGFRPMEVRNQRGELYERLSNEFSYVLIDEQVDFTSSREFDRYLRKMDIDQDIPALVRTGDGWVLAGDDELLDALSEPLDTEYVSAWPGDEDDALNGALDEETFDELGQSDSDNDDSNQISMAPVDGEEPDGSTAIDHGLRTLSQLELVEHEQRLALSKTAPTSNRGNVQPPDEEEPDDGPGGNEPEETPGEGEIDPPDEQPDSQPDTTAPLLIPGTGWAGLSGPNDAGAIPGGDGPMPIARWDVVPYQEFDERFTIGVVAFHIDGIDRVSFSVENGPWQDVEVMTNNDRTDVIEYTAALDASVFDDGLVEVRAIVVPNKGPARILQGKIVGGNEVAVRNGNHSMYLNANGGGTLPSMEVYVAGNGDDANGNGTEARPYKSFRKAMQHLGADANGGVILCKEGEYAYGGGAWPSPVVTDRWVTIRPAEGVDKSDVVINRGAVGGYGALLSLVRLQGLTIKHDGTTAGPRFTGAKFWFDDIDYFGNRTVDYKIISYAWSSGEWVTDSFVTNSRNSLRGANFQRDVHVGTTSGSPFGDSPLVINSVCDKYDNSGTTFHGDVFHWFQENDDLENVIAYGVMAKDFDTQGIAANVFRGGSRMDNVAFVNVEIAKGSDNAAGSWWERSTDHLLFWHVTMPDQPMRWKLDAYGSELTNVSIRNSVWGSFSGDTDPFPSDADVKNNHFIDIESYGSWTPDSDADLTTGDAGFANTRSHDFTPSAGSILARRVDFEHRVIQCDVEGVYRDDISAIGARVSADER